MSRRAVRSSSVGAPAMGENLAAASAKRAVISSGVLGGSLAGPRQKGVLQEGRGEVTWNYTGMLKSTMVVIETTRVSL